MKKKNLLLASAMALFGAASLSSCSVKVNIVDDDTKTIEETTGKTYQELVEENEKLSKELSELKEDNEAKEDMINYLYDEMAYLEKRINLAKESKYEIVYTDYLGNDYSYQFEIDNETSVLADLSSKFDVKSNASEYGTFINSIENSIVDPYWSIMMYENRMAAETGIDGLVANPGDVFEFKNECWNSVESGYGNYDSYDVLVDKVIYNYVNKKMADKFSNLKTWTGSEYWDFLSYYHLKNAGYSVHFDFNEDFNNSVVNADQENIPTATEYATVNNYFKYFYATRLFDEPIDLTTFSNSLSTYLSSYPDPSEYSEYTAPFMFSIAKTLNLGNNITNYDKYQAYKPDATAWGPDGLCWLYTGLQSVSSIENKLVDLKYEDLNNSLSKDVSLSSFLLPYAAVGADARKFEGNIDLIKILFDEYFDESEMKFTTEASNSDYSSNQIYAALVAYKIARDKKTGVVLFE